METEPFLEECLVWDYKEGGYDAHHVYGFAVTKKGTVLAFSEGREKSKDDNGPKDQLLKRSTDGGRTWGNDIFIEKCDGTFWEANGHPGVRETWTNCAPIPDKITGKIFYFYALNDFAEENLQRVTKVFYKVSEDDGLTWSDRVEVTGILNVKKDRSPNKDASGNWILNEYGFPSDYLGRAMHMPGPGHGIQASGGRLILQFWNRTSVRNTIDERLYGVTLIYSDDHGESWQFGGFIDEGNSGMNESRLEELEDGTLYCNARWAMGGLAHRIVSTSIGDTLDKWTTLKLQMDLGKTATVDGGLIRLSHSNTDKKSRILHCKSNDAP